MSRIGRTNLVLFIVIALFAVFSLGALLWLQGRFQRERADTIAAIKENFSVEALGLPEDLETFRFLNLESTDRRLLQNNAYVRGIVVTKMVLENGKLVEHVLHPWFYTLKHPDWKKRLAAYDRHVLRRQWDGVKYGAIYFDFDYSRRNSVRIAIAVLGALLLTVLALVGRRLRVQEVALTRTTVELQEKKRELVELERLSLAGQLSANIFHDIRKPLLNIRMDVEELESRHEASVPVRERVEDIRRQIELFFGILRDLNIEHFVRGDQGEREYVDINDLLKRSCALVHYERRGVEVEEHFAPSPPPILAFPYRLILVFSNIILNAYQAMQGKGRLSLKTRLEANALVVEIADSGPGIPTDQLERVFEPFFSTRQESGGSGLGLYICKGIIEELNGQIKAFSESGKGTVFEIRLPISVESADNDGIAIERETTSKRPTAANGGRSSERARESQA